MNIQTITVPKGIEYISDVAEIKEIYNNDLPHNCIISKEVTGCGGTSIVLSNDEPYVVAVHLVEMIKCKVNQKDRYENILGVYSGVSVQDIRDYTEAGGKKIMVTYDSLPKVKEALGAEAKNYRLLVDEFHKLVAYLGHFKPSVCIKLLESDTDFKSVSYLTATPTNYTYLPKPMKTLDIVEFNWEGKISPDLTHCYVKEGMVERVLSTVLDKLDNTTDELYIFYNSKIGVASFLKKLFKCKRNLTLADVNIMFANNETNTKYFKKHLGTKFDYGTPPDGTNNKRINVISSMGFEGIDYYPNNSGALPVSIIVSDPDSKSMRYDINVDLVQILGRFRKHKISNRKVNNQIIYLWNTQKSDFFLDESAFLAKIEKDKESSIQHLKTMEGNEITHQLTVTALKSKDFDHLILEDSTPILHPYGIEAQMSAYTSMHSDSSILGNIDQEGNVASDGTIITKLSNLNPDLSTFTIPLLPAEYTKALGRTPSVRKLVEEYDSLYEELAENSRDPELRQECQDAIDNFLILNPLFSEWINAGLTPAMMRSCNLKRETISERATQSRTLLCNTDEVKGQLSLKVGEVYTRDELLEKVLAIYESLGMQVAKPKATDIKKWYEIKSNPKRVKGELKTAYKILKEL